MLSMQEEIHTPVFIEPVPAALPLRTRCFQVGGCPRLVGACIRTVFAPGPPTENIGTKPALGT